jgi:hypothetical protein
MRSAGVLGVLVPRALGLVLGAKQAPAGVAVGPETNSIEEIEEPGDEVV